MISRLYITLMRLIFGRKRKFILTAKEEKNIIDNMGIPESDIESSYFQYNCQNAVRMNRIFWLLLNVISFVFFFPTILFFLVKGMFLKQGDTNSLIVDKIIYEHKLLPSSLLQRYKTVRILEKDKASLAIEDLSILHKVFFEYPISFFFLYKCLYMISVYSYAINKFHPQVIVCSAEYSFTSSILTLFCEKHGVLHYNVMHGEKRFDIIDAFSRFHKFYVWDEYYIKLFENLKTMTKIQDFVLYHPTIPKVQILRRDNTCTYYLQTFNKSMLKDIKKNLEKTGLKYKVRPHPAYNRKEIYEVFDIGCIETTSNVDIWESIRKAGKVIAQDSTVLYQAYLLNVPVVVDDILDEEFFHELCERQYIILDKPHMLLSELIS